MTNRRNRITKGTVARDNVETAICYTDREHLTKNEHEKALIERIYVKRYYWHAYWKEEITQIMWEALYEAKSRYQRYGSITGLEEYIEKVIQEHVG